MKEYDLLLCVRQDNDAPNGVVYDCFKAKAWSGIMLNDRVVDDCSGYQWRVVHVCPCLNENELDNKSIIMLNMLKQISSYSYHVDYGCFIDVKIHYKKILMEEENE